MTLKNKNPWKYLSVGLLGVIAIGLFAPVHAAPGGAQSGWQVAVAGLQGQIDTLGTVTCTDITGGGGLCDGSDDIVSALEIDPSNTVNAGIEIDDDVSDTDNEICPTNMVMRGLTVSQDPANDREWGFTVHCAELKVIP